MTSEKKKLNVVGGLTDLLIFVMFVGGAGFAGYFIGINQKLAPVSMVPPGTVEAIEYIAERAAGLRGGGQAPGQAQPPGAAPAPPPPTNPNALPVKKDEPAAKSKVESETTPAAKQPSASEEPKVVEESKTPVSVTDKQDAKSAKQDAKSSKQDAKLAKAAKDSKAALTTLKKKYWVASSGNDYIGSSITVVVNGQPVDNFFGPGKLVDVSRFVKKGANQITFDSKVLDDEYNQHLGNNKFDLTLKLVSGASVREDFDTNAVLLTFKRTAADMDDGSNSLDFTAKE
jgi:hypothetical protein